MPEDARNMMIFASFRDEFRKMCQVGLKTKDGKKIIRTHLKAMKQELNMIVKRDQKKAEEAEREAITMPSSSAPNTHVPPNKPKTHKASSYQGGIPATNTNTQQESSYQGVFPHQTQVRSMKAATKGRFPLQALQDQPFQQRIKCRTHQNQSQKGDHRR